MKATLVIPFIIYVSLLVLMILQSYYNYLYYKKHPNPTTETRYLENINLALFGFIIVMFFIQITIISFGKTKTIYSLPHPITRFI